MENRTPTDFKARVQNLITYQDVLMKNSLQAQRSCDQEFDTFLTFYNDLRRKYNEVRVYANQLEQDIEQYRGELERKEKKMQSQSAQILRLTQHNKRSNERLSQLQQYLDRIKGSLVEQNTYDQLCDMLRDSLMSESETTADLSDKNCTGDELEYETSHMPKVVSQSTGIGAPKRLNATNHETSVIHRTTTATSKVDMNNNEIENEHICTSPYANITVARSSRHSISVHQRAKQKNRRPSKEFLHNKSEESELSTDDVFWSKHPDIPHPPEYDVPHAPPTHPKLSQLTSPIAEQKPLTPSTPNGFATASPCVLGTLRSRAHHFVSRNILIPETCCVCLKRIHFGKLAYRCQTCNALCHTGCKENCSTLCLPNVKTPSRGVVAKFTSRETNQLQVPPLLVHCIKEIEQRGLQEVGIYRLNVVEGQVKELKDRLLKSRTGLLDLSHYHDIHLICGVVKDFLRSLSESLLTDALWKSFAAVVDEPADLTQQQKFDSLIHQLPKPNRETLAFLILHLQRVAESPLCRMPISNLSRTMGPAVIGYSTKHISDADIIGETYKQTKILEVFLKLSSDFWTKFLEESEINESLSSIHKPQLATPTLARQQQYHHTPIAAYPAPLHTFFSPI
ncbi:unnamed protein product [Adineta ricciae]|uniref:Rac GTPase-activating protein 1 n=1 Tax=Adineta ricciae TaxID=249248 RepID=A0A814FRM6_ADIRI|nr:unnamed protein product [Adineta ricciae]CAF0987319.1 unnamed protein product [Adineta ricciae]